MKGIDHWADCFSEIAAFGCVQSMGIFVSIVLRVAHPSGKRPETLHPKLPFG